MLSCDNYGVVYTPRKLATFVSSLLVNELLESFDIYDDNIINILDPACGEAILLEETSKMFSKKNILNSHCFGITNSKGKKVIIISFYHPANRYPSLLNYYAICGIYQQALKTNNF